jgi:hypothetical protein
MSIKNIIRINLDRANELCCYFIVEVESAECFHLNSALHFRYTFPTPTNKSDFIFDRGLLPTGNNDTTLLLH